MQNIGDLATKSELSDFRSEVKAEFTRLKGDLYIRLDGIVGALQDIRQDQVIAHHSSQKIEEKVEAFDKALRYHRLLPEE